MDFFNCIFQAREDNNYKKVQPKIKKQAEIYKLSKFDKKRQINNKQKNSVWFNANKAQNFDIKFFRLDIINCLVIKDIKYNNNFDNNYVFAVEYEHFVSYSNYGKTTESNICLLNAEINRKKKDKALYEHSLCELYGLQSLYGITEHTLLCELNTDLHNTCKKYNLLFIYKAKNDYWTLRVDKNGNYRIYNDEYLNSYRNYDKDTEFYVKEIKKLHKRLIQNLHK